MELALTYFHESFEAIKNLEIIARKEKKFEYLVNILEKKKRLLPQNDLPQIDLEIAQIKVIHNFEPQKWLEQIGRASCRERV